jgi:hypothetical protein
MPRLQLVFNCLNLFVSDPENDVVHVLMPSTDGHGNGHKHEVRLRHTSFKGKEKTHGRPMEGLALILGKPQANGAGTTGDGTADTDLAPAQPSTLNEVLVNLSTITGHRVSRDLVKDEFHKKVAARVSLYGGKVTQMVAEEEFIIRKKQYAMAHQVTWEMLGVPHALEWVKLDPTASEPIQSLLELPAEPNQGYRLEISHTMPGSPSLTPKEVKEHYAMLYPLLGIDHPASDLLPHIVGNTDGAKCVGGTALVAPE